jgi:hypothetical protein
MPRRSGHLAVTAITNDKPLLSRLLASPLLHRLNLGPLPAYQVSWDQPHRATSSTSLRAPGLAGRLGAA